MDLVLNGMEELNEQELMMVDGGGIFFTALAVTVGAAMTVVSAAAGSPTTIPLAIATVERFGALVTYSRK